MSHQALEDIVGKAVADYGFRLAVMWGVDDVIAMSDLTPAESGALRSLIVPALKDLPDPVEPSDRAEVQTKIMRLAQGN